jgi:hypothetical protein
VISLGVEGYKNAEDDLTSLVVSFSYHLWCGACLIIVLSFNAGSNTFGKGASNLVSQEYALAEGAYMLDNEAGTTMQFVMVL